jgi:hypothetical protein
MATMNRDMQGEGREGQQQGTQGVGSPISNEAYNLIAALHEKLEGLEAYRKYAKDGQSQIWKQLTESEVKGVELLVQELENMVQNGKLRMGEPGKAGPAKPKA